MSQTRPSVLILRQNQCFHSGGRSVLRLLIAVVMVASSALVSPAQTAPNPKDYTAHAVGYAHMDMAWLWRWEESIHDVMYNTFSNQLQLMDQNPNYTFAQDQAVVLDSMEHFYPEVFKGLVQHAKTGGFVPATSGWVQMDENVVDGDRWCGNFSMGKSTASRSLATTSAWPGSRTS